MIVFDCYLMHGSLVLACVHLGVAAKALLSSQDEYETTSAYLLHPVSSPHVEAVSIVRAASRMYGSAVRRVSTPGSCRLDEAASRGNRGA